MLRKEENKIKYSFNHCQQCGICEVVCPKQAISMRLRHDGTHDIIVDHDKCIICGRCVKACPANAVYDYEGYFEGFNDKKYFLGYNVDKKIRRESSSGGVCKTLIIEALKSGLVDGVYSLRKTDSYPYAEGVLYTRENIPSYDDIPNSVYHSVMACENADKIQRCERLMIVGTACQLRALRTVAKTKSKELTEVCIFCKQQKTLDSTRFLAKIMETKIPENLKFSTRYRGMGWQGIVRVNESELPWNRAAQIPFAKRLWTVSGCDICGDSFGILAGADISLMDPWIIRPTNDLGETLITVHTDKGMALLKAIDKIGLEEKTFKEVEPALSLRDVWRKQQCEPYFRGKPVSPRVRRGAKGELLMRRCIKAIAETLPRMPILFYRILARFPDFRRMILK